MIARSLAAGLLLLSAAAAAQSFAVTNAKLASGTGTPAVDGATIVVRDGRIATAGVGVAVPPGTPTVDAQGRWVTPGIVAGISRLGLIEVDAVDPSDDAEAETAPFSAALDVAPAINPRSVNIAINRMEGVTRAAVAPAIGQTVFAGQGAVIQLGEGNDPVVKPRAFQFVELGEAGADAAGGSRPAAFAIFTESLREAQALAAGRPAIDAGISRDAVINRADARALVPVVQGKQPLLVHVNRAQDIARVLELTRDFPALRLILVGVDEGWLVADRIAAAKVPVIVNALNDLPERFETVAATQSNAGRMVRAGVTVALGQLDDNDARQMRLLPQAAGNLVALTRVPGATGLSHEQALATITSAPATIFGIDAGSIAPGKRADLVIWDGDPLELSSAATAVYIDGRAVPMESRQTKLRDRYHPANKTGMPLHYTR